MTQIQRVAMVVGASRGIGRRCALALAQKGYDLSVCSRTLEGHEAYEISETVQRTEKRALPGSLRELAGEVEETLGRKALPVKVDLLESSDIDRFFEQTMQEFGRVDVLVNAQKYVGPGHRDLFVDTPYSVFDDAVRINCLAPLYLTKSVVPVMIEQRSGLIVNVTSGFGEREMPALANGTHNGPPALSYGVSKAGFNRLGPGLAKELRSHGIAVVNLEPGRTWTERKVVQRGEDFDTSVEVPPEASGLTCAYIATCADPMFYSGMTIQAPDFAIEHGLIDPELMPPPHGRSAWGAPGRSR
jgi:NAD(P)-dependent dehydrogenase (short-subunit alcohol dehydrogenase family)